MTNDTLIQNLWWSFAPVFLSQIVHVQFAMFLYQRVYLSVEVTSPFKYPFFKPINSSMTTLLAAEPDWSHSPWGSHKSPTWIITWCGFVIFLCSNHKTKGALNVPLQKIWLMGVMSCGEQLTWYKDKLLLFTSSTSNIQSAKWPIRTLFVDLRDTLPCQPGQNQDERSENDLFSCVFAQVKKEWKNEISTMIELLEPSNTS